MSKKTLATVSASDFVDHSTYAGADFYSEYSAPFWDVDSGSDENGDPIGWCAEEPAFSPNIWDQLQLGSDSLPGKWRLSGSMSLDMDVQKPQGFDGGALITRGYVPAMISMEGTLWTPEQWAIFQNIFPAIWTRPHKISGQDVQLGAKGQVAQAQSATYAQQVAALQMEGFTLAKSQAQITANAALQKQVAGTAAPNTQQSSGLIVGQQLALTIAHPACQQAGISSVVLSRVYLPEPGPIHGTMIVKFDAREYVPEPNMIPKTAQKATKGTQTKRGPNAFQKKIAPSGDPSALAPGKVPTTEP